MVSVVCEADATRCWITADEPRQMVRRDGRRAGPSDASSSAVIQQRGELLRLGHRPPAGEALAHVGGGAAVDRLAALEQRHVAGLAAGQRRCAGGSARARRPRAARGRRRRARPRARGARWKSSACSRCPKPAGCCGAIVCSSRSCADAPPPRSGARRSARPAAAARTRRPSRRPGSARRRAPCAARRAARRRRRWRRSRRCSGSAKRSSIVSASARASANQRGSNVAS